MISHELLCHIPRRVPWLRSYLAIARLQLYGSRVRSRILPTPHEEVGDEHVTTAQLFHHAAYQRYMDCVPVQQWFLVPPVETFIIDNIQ